MYIKSFLPSAVFDMQLTELALYSRGEKIHSQTKSKTDKNKTKHTNSATFWQNREQLKPQLGIVHKQTNQHEAGRNIVAPKMLIIKKNKKNNLAHCVSEKIDK